MKSSTRSFLVSGFGSLAVLAFVFWRAGKLFYRIGMFGPDKAVQTQTLTLLACFFGPIVILGIVVAWVRLLYERRERAKRAPPLSLD